MSLALCGRLLKSTAHFVEKPGLRYRKGLYGKTPGEPNTRTLEQRIAELNYQDPTLHYRVNIGYPIPTVSRKEVMLERHTQRVQVKKNHELELAARDRTLKVDLDKVRQNWNESSAPHQIYETAKYYNIYEDLFEESYFYPVTPLSIAFQYPRDETLVTPVYRGNLIKPAEATQAPEVIYPANKDELFTLVLSTPDCHFTKEDGEVLHWLVGNIPGNEIQKGELLCDYLRPFPPRGSGYSRYVFILYRQEKKIDLSEYRREAPCTNLTARTFSTYEFYRRFQDEITPTGLAFFESSWDHSLTKFFQDVLEMPEPVVEYDFPVVTLPEQKWFPHRQPFNLYLDRFKDPKQLQKELLVEKLKERHPFKPAPIPPKFPLAYDINSRLPTWLREDIKRRRMKEGKYKFM